jgi:Bacterial regulatory proteins, luxR family
MHERIHAHQSELGDSAVGTKLPPLEEQAYRVYGWVLDYGRVDYSKMVAELSIEADKLRAAVERLTEWRLLRELPDCSTVVAARPDRALAEMMHPLETAISRFQLEASRVRDEFDALLAMYLVASGQGTTVQLTDDVDIADALQTLVGSCQREVLVTNPGKSPLPVALRESLWGKSPLLFGAAQVRVLYQHSSRFDATAREHAELARSAGAEVRTVSELHDRVIVFDSEVALLSGDHGQDSVMVLEMSVVNFLVQTFNQAWNNGSDFAGEARWRCEARELVDTAQQDIIRMLMDGARDETIAQRLNISLRTCRRHIANIMKRLDAKSRFHAGYLLGQQRFTG